MLLRNVADRLGPHVFCDADHPEWETGSGHARRRHGPRSFRKQPRPAKPERQKNSRLMSPTMQDLSLHVLDVAENSINAQASLVQISLSEDHASDILELVITDDGRGMDAELLAAATSPFATTRTTRKFGLGLPLLAQSAENAEGSLRIESKPGEGCRVSATFRLSHSDLFPVGDLEGTLMTLIVGNHNTDFLFRHQRDGMSFTLDTRELRREMGDIPLFRPEAIRELRKRIREGLEKLGVTELPVPDSAQKARETGKAEPSEARTGAAAANQKACYGG